MKLPGKDTLREKGHIIYLLLLPDDGFTDLHKANTARELHTPPHNMGKMGSRLNYRYCHRVRKICVFARQGCVVSRRLGD